jgi:hypothetical protein
MGVLTILLYLGIIQLALSLGFVILDIRFQSVQYYRRDTWVIVGLMIFSGVIAILLAYSAIDEDDVRYIQGARLYLALPILFSLTLLFG